MKLSISNIAWRENFDDVMYEKLALSGYSGLEIAPTRIFKENPYDNVTTAGKWARILKQRFDISISSMQSIWYGRKENIWRSEEERQFLLNYTKKAIDFASVIECGNLVFGCPRNRNCSVEMEYDIAVEFFRELGNYASNSGTCIGLEANPTIYNTNFINTTEEAIQLINDVASEGFKLNLDIGTMLQNLETISVLKGYGELINHVHISEPGLKPIVNHDIHIELGKFLENIKYSNYVSIEMGSVDEIALVEDIMLKVKNIFV